MTFVWYDTAKQYFQCFHGLELTRYFFFDTIKRFYFGVLQTDATGAKERGEPMLFYALLAAIETLLIAGVAVLLLLGNLPPVIVVLLTVALVLLVFIFRPARTLLVRRQVRKRRVLHRHKMTRKHMDVLRTPSPIPPACVARLMEAGTLLTSDKAQTSALVSTLLDLNCRGFLSISMAEPLENMTMTLTPQQGQGTLEPFESYLLRVLQKMVRPATGARLSFLVEYAATHCAALRRRADRFFALLDRTLLNSGDFIYVRYRPKHQNGKVARIPQRRLALTAQGEEHIAAWDAYFNLLVSHPEMDGYPEDLPAFEKELQRAFVYAAGGGIFVRAKESLLREFLFAPQQIWGENCYLSHVAYLDDAIYPLVLDVCANIVSYGTKRYRPERWEEDLAQVQS